MCTFQEQGMSRWKVLQVLSWRLIQVQKEPLVDWHVTLMLKILGLMKTEEIHLFPECCHRIPPGATCSLTAVMAWKRRESQTKSTVFLASPLYSELIDSSDSSFFAFAFSSARAAVMDEQDFLLAQNQLLEEVHQPLCRRQSPQVWDRPEPLEMSQAREVQHLYQLF